MFIPYPTTHINYYHQLDQDNDDETVVISNLTKERTIEPEKATNTPVETRPKPTIPYQGQTFLTRQTAWKHTIAD